MNRQNFGDKDRFPLSIQSLNFMQEMILASARLSAIGGQNYILSGCSPSGNSVTEGVIVINGEMMPFDGGTVGETITIVETPESVSANGLTFEKARVRRKAVFATGTGENYYPWADFKPLRTNQQLEEAKATVAYVDERIAGIQAGSIPAGVIVMWSGSEAAIPGGWALCDGREISSGVFTPNLSGKFIVGFNRQDKDYDQVGKTGGKKEVILNTEHLPKHKHEIDDYFCYDNYDLNLVDKKIADGKISAEGGDSFRNVDYTKNSIFYKKHDTYETGGGQSHENRPPYYVLAFIIKIDIQN